MPDSVLSPHGPGEGDSRGDMAVQTPHACLRPCAEKPGLVLCPTCAHPRW